MLGIVSLELWNIYISITHLFLPAGVVKELKCMLSQRATNLTIEMSTFFSKE